MKNDVQGPLDAPLYQGNLLNDRVRRDIAGLNRLFLQQALDPAVGIDPWFSVPPPAMECLRVAEPAALERAAGSPFTLFELALPAPDARDGDAVADQPSGAGVGLVQRDARRAFGMAVLSVVRTLCEGVPLAPRLAFGLAPHAEARLATLSLAESYELAAWPGLIRPRWTTNTRMWTVLSHLLATPDAQHWAWATGLCLLAPCERRPSVVAYSARRRPRPGHARGVSDGPDVPC